MAGEYIISFTDPSKGTFTIEPNTINGPGNPNSNTPLQLHGRYVINYGTIISNNLVRLLENFASSTPPTPTTSGMLWFDSAANGGEGILKVRNSDNDGWISVGSGLDSGGTGGKYAIAPVGNFTAESGKNYFINTSSSAVTVTLPASPVVGDPIGFCDLAGTFNVNNLSINGNGSLIMGDPSVMVNDVQYSEFRLCYSGTTYGWRLIS